MVSCAVPGCKNRTDRITTSRSLTYHLFPRNPQRRAEWAAHVGGPSWQVTSQSARVCSIHFLERFFDRTGQTVRLREDAVPTLYVYGPTAHHSFIPKGKRNMAGICAPLATSSHSLLDPVGNMEGVKTERYADQSEGFIPGSISGFACQQYSLPENECHNIMYHIQLPAGASLKIVHSVPKSQCHSTE